MPAVLIVDDEKSICDLLRDALSSHGYVCAAATGSEGALNQLNQRQFDLVLLDIKMPGLSGMDMLTLIKQSHPIISVIMVTAVNDTAVAAEAMKRGASGYILKPFGLEEVRVKIALTLSGKGLDGNLVEVENGRDNKHHISGSQ